MQAPTNEPLRSAVAGYMALAIPSPALCICCCWFYLPMLLLVLQVNSSIHTFTVQELHAASDAPAAGYTNEPDVPPAQAPPAAAASHSVCPVLQAFACNRSIRCLTLHKLQVGRVLQLAAALANGGCENSLQQLGLPGARWG